MKEVALEKGDERWENFFVLFTWFLLNFFLLFNVVIYKS